MRRTRPLTRAAAVLVATAALTVAPTSAFGANINGGSGDDVLNGTPSADTITGDPVLTGVGGNDTINGGGGNDVISGDGVLVGIGGDDVIDGGDGDDVISGDGLLVGVGGNDTIYGGGGNDTIYGDGIGVGIGGDDTIYGGDGDDVIYGDGPGVLIGGDDILYGGEGDDTLYGQGGNDILCGGPGTNILIGGEGIDLACAVDDLIDVLAGAETVFGLAANDEVLDDDPAEDGPLRYFLLSVPAGMVALLDELTGVLTFTANASGTIVYEVRRWIDGVNFLGSQADVIITVTQLPQVDPDPTEPTTATPAIHRAVLPDTGLDADLLGFLVAGLMFLVAGAGVLVRGRSVA